MKKRRFLPYIVSLFLLTGCGSSGSIYSNFRDGADLLPVQTLGDDRVDGKVRLSVSSGRGTDELPTVILQGSGSSITEALEMVQDYSDWEDLFFAHIRYVVVGEQAAREGLDELMDWFERIPQTRLDVPIFLVEGGDAASLVAGSGDKHEITSVLHSLQRDAARRGFTVCYTLADVAKRLAEDDCALCSSVRSVEVGGHVPTAPEGKTALESGFALLQDGVLTAFTGEDAARGLCLLLNRAGTGRVELSDGQGGHATVELTECRAENRAEFSPGGAAEDHIFLRCRAGIMEIDSQLEPGELLDTLDKAFSDWLAARVRGALEVVKANGADIFSLEEQFTRLDAGRAALLSFPEDVKFFLGVDAKVERSYDLSAAENLHGGEM